MSKPNDVLSCLQSMSESLKEIAVNTSPVKVTTPAPAAEVSEAGAAAEAVDKKGKK